ncbi:MAG: isoleucine--tRNA ligase, partial [Promethearchaeota archaeon]
MEPLGKFKSDEIEERVLQWWKDEKIYEKVKQTEPKDKKFFFLDGPPYTTGNVHLGTAWNKIMKDVVIKYKRMQGYRVTDTPGYDTHGLPIEVVIEKQLGIANKKEIIEYGLDNFIKKCRTYAESKIGDMNEQFIRLGCAFWNWSDPYITLKNTYIQGIWWTLKKAWENGYLYQYYKPQNCCPRCGTALAKHEFEYQDITDTAIFVKFRSVDAPNTFFVIWTTTPWTLVSNTNIMANPDTEYVKMKVKDEYWIMAIAATSDLLQNKLGLKVNDPEGFSYGTRYTGYDLEGKRYIHPLIDEVPYQNELEKQESKVHTIVLSREYVQETGGSGLVHTAPGHGPEDFEVGLENHIPIFSPVDMNGCYTKKAGKLFEGKFVHTANQEIIELLKEKDTLVYAEKIQHEYAHCWRCHSKLVYRATEQWFFKTSALKEQMLKENSEIKWIPHYAGATNFKSWLTHLYDWCISRQRYWGIPLSIWICDNKDCKNMHVIGSADELKEIAGTCPEDLHKPWIDKVTWKCPKCGGTMRRTPDVLDVWLDSGSVMWASQKFVDGHEHYDTWEPADFILEGKDQIRGWFNSLLCSAMVSSKRRNYNACYMHGWVLSHGAKMSKSLGNALAPQDVIEGKVEILTEREKEQLRKQSAYEKTSKFDKAKDHGKKKTRKERKKKFIKDDKRWSNVKGIETFRFYSVKATPPGKDFNFDYKEYTDTFKTLNTLWNSYLFAQEKMSINGFIPNKYNLKVSELNPTNRWMISRTNSFIGELTELFENYELPSIPSLLEKFILNDLSRWYITIIRDWVDVNSSNIEHRNQTLATLWYVLYRLTLLMAPVNPMLMEEIYQKFCSPMLEKAAMKSVHLEHWPVVDEELLDSKLEAEMESTRNIIDKVRTLKTDLKIKLRWPTKALILVPEKESTTKFKESDLVFKELIREMSNVKELTFQEEKPTITKLKETQVPGLYLYLDLQDTKDLQQERILSDLLRQLQDLRKRAHLKVGDPIHLTLGTAHPFLLETLKERKNQIATKVHAKELVLTEKEVTSQENTIFLEFFVCVNNSCYAMIRDKQVQKVKDGQSTQCSYCKQDI